MLERWWNEWPGRLQHELEQLEALGHNHSVNDYEAAGRLEITIDYSRDDIACTLLARYPDEFPFFPVELWCTEDYLGRHQDPLDGRLCTLHDPGNHWSVSDTLAHLIDSQVSRLFDVIDEPSGTFAAENEFHQGDPLSEYVPCEIGSSIIVGDICIPPDATSGKIRLNITSQQPIKGAVLTLTDERTGDEFLPDEWIRNRFDLPPEQQVDGKWARIESKIDIKNPTSIFESVYGKRLAQLPRSIKPRVAVAIFKDEVAWRQYGDGWIILFFPPNKSSSGVARPQPYFVRPDRCGDEELFARMPEVRPIRDKRILVVGLGMLGAPSAIQLARAGVAHLTLIDPDHVEGSTIVRWGLGHRASGQLKAIILSDYINQQYPYVRAEGAAFRVGDPIRDDKQQRASDFFYEALTHADLVLDTAAEATVSNFLAHKCRSLGKPHIIATTTPGTRGGIVCRTHWPKTGCWSCMKHLQRDSDQSGIGPVVSPNALEGEIIQPAGCRIPTVTGYGFDSDLIALTAARYAISTLCSGRKDAYPQMASDGVVINMRGGGGELISPSFTEFDLPRHPECYCARK